MMKIVVLILCVFSVWAESAKIQTKGVGGRIIGGEPANAGEFPFAAAIYKQTISGTYFCTGALFLSKWVITAGQCVESGLMFTVRLGSNNLNDNNPNVQRLATDKYHLHPDFNLDTLENDIGLIEFRLPITYSDYIRPINILVSTSLPDYSYVLTLGWGQTSDSVPGVVEDLQFTYLTTLTNEECRLTFGNQVNDNMVCAEGNYNQGTCRGDLGSPLIQYGGSSGLVYHVGVSSFISSNGCESTDPSGFTRSSPYLPWINNITSSG